MAYEKRYQASWGSTSKGGLVYIYELDYADSVIDTLELEGKGISISREINDWEDYILALVCEINIVNNGDNYFDLLDLLLATERKYKVVVEKSTAPSPYVIFEGFLNVEVGQQRYLKYSIIRLVASSYLSKLEHVYPASFDTLQNLTLIDIINEILTSIGSEDNIRVYADRYPVEDTLATGQTFLNKVGLYTEVFWINNIDRKTSFEILGSILKSFDCYMYWYDGYWYIEQYDVLWTTSKYYIEYVSGDTYTPAQAGSVIVAPVLFPVSDVHDLQFINTSQLLSTIPGNNLVQIRINNQSFLNLTINDFSNATGVDTDVPNPTTIRSWMYWDEGGDDMTWFPSATGPHKNMDESILRLITSPGYTAYERGLYTKFATTVYEETKLSLKFIYSFEDLAHAGVPFTGVWENYTWTFRWYLRIIMPGYPDYPFIRYDYLGSGEWEIVGNTGATPEEASLQEIVIEGTEFDPDNQSVEVSINIPLGLIAGIIESGEDSHNYSFVFCIGTETCHRHPGGYYNPAAIAHFGDVNITTSGHDLDTNIIEGNANSDFLGKKVIELDLADVSDLNYKNGFLRGTGLLEQTTEWTDGSSDSKPLVDWILVDKFRLYNVSKQRITSEVLMMNTSSLRLFSLYTESKQSGKQFILMGYRYVPSEDLYEVDLLEYDNSTAINLIG